MAQGMAYDDRDLRLLFSELEPKRRLQAIRGGFRREANKVRRAAVNNLRGSVRSGKDLEKGVRAVVSRRAAGFRVTVGTRRAGSRGQEKPVLIWAEDGTKDRKTKGGGRAARRRAAHRTGRMRRYGFMARTKRDVRDSVTADIRDMVTDNVKRISQKYGCRQDKS